ncbi:hypothetical protein [Seonamhaeicola maritimus]|uniref:Lipoprotein n=1 Tax=Seonamhaeicola maritimus TaxID=2591822 RepID=A0A5C7GGK8_9FLAO|nr:hypothetical protein [Seonamhaeicola maritimus]TXG36880.1 hypothetical protein FUA22_09905 [Seonamhaeicola maritimus]
MKKIIIITLFLFLVSSCKESEQSLFEENGLSFICAKGWSVVDKEFLEGDTYFLSLEKDGFDSSGAITLVVSDYFINSNANIEAYQNELKTAYIFKKANIVFEPIKFDKFNGFDCKSSDFTFKLLGLEHHGIIYSFFKDDRSFLILRQEAIEDRTDNEEGFHLFESTLIFI